jgi:hypothetical protein
MNEDEAIAAGMAEFRRTIRPRIRIHALVIVAIVVLVSALAEVEMRRVIGFAGLSAIALWFVLAWIERTWLPANLRDRYRRSGTPS